MKEISYSNKGDKNIKQKNINTNAYFLDSDQALFWYMEQKRKQFIIQTSKYDYDNTTKSDGNIRDLTISELLKWGGIIKFPQTHAEKTMVIAVLDEIFETLDEKTQQILTLHYLGDFASEFLYSQAVKNQKILKERGYRTILFYKYPKTRVGKLLHIDRKTVTRRVQAAFKILHKDLIKRGFIIGKDM